MRLALYSIDDGTLKNIVNQEERLISINLNPISDELNDVFDRLLFMHG